MRRGLGLSLVFLAAAALPATAAESVPISLRFRPGQVFRYSLEQSLLVSFQLPGQTTTELRSEVRAVVRRQVLFVTADGTAELLCRMESWQRQNWVGQTAASADRAERETVLATPLRLRISPRGLVQLVEPRELPAAVDLDSYGDFSFLPQRPTAAGQEWTGLVTTKVQGVEATTATKSRLESIQSGTGARVAQITQDVRIEMPWFKVPANGTAVHQMEASGSFLGAGAISFDLDAGAPLEQLFFYQGKFSARLQVGESRVEVPLRAELTTSMVFLS